MRLVTYRSEAGTSAGVQTVEGIIDAGMLLGERPVGLRELIEAVLLDQLTQTDRALAEKHAGVDDALHRLHPGTGSGLAAVGDQPHLGRTLTRGGTSGGRVR